MNKKFPFYLTRKSWLALNMRRTALISKELRIKKLSRDDDVELEALQKFSAFIHQKMYPLPKMPKFKY